MGVTETQLSGLTGMEIKIIFDNHIEKNTIFDVEIEGLIKRPYWFVKVELPELIEAGLLTELVRILLLLQGDKEEAELIDDATPAEILAVICWVRSELKRIVELEAKYLTSPPDPDRVNAGVKELDKFGELNVIRAIAKGNILVYEDIKKLPYSVIFDELYIGKTERDIETRLAEIKKGKNKGGK